jgi:integrase
LNKWLKKDFDGLTAHCLRHTFRDRLRAVECPMDLIDQIGGWSSFGTVGSNYRKGHSAKIVSRSLITIKIT